MGDAARVRRAQSGLRLAAIWRVLLPGSLLPPALLRLAARIQALHLGPRTSERQPRVLLRRLMTKKAMATTKKTVPTETRTPGVIGRSVHIALDAACALVSLHWRGRASVWPQEQE